MSARDDAWYASWAERTFGREVMARMAAAASRAKLAWWGECDRALLDSQWTTGTTVADLARRALEAIDAHLGGTTSRGSGLARVYVLQAGAPQRWATLRDVLALARDEASRLANDASQVRRELNVSEDARGPGRPPGSSRSAFVAEARRLLAAMPKPPAKRFTPGDWARIGIGLRVDPAPTDGDLKRLSKDYKDALDRLASRAPPGKPRRRRVSRAR